MARKANSPTISITGVDQMARAINQHDQKVKRVIAAEFLRAKPEATTFAKTNAPWTDQSGNARAGLHADVQSIEGGKAFELVMAGSVFYQIFLETRFSGKYAILMPTVNYIGKVLLRRIDAQLARMELA